MMCCSQKALGGRRREPSCGHIGNDRLSDRSEANQEGNRWRWLKLTSSDCLPWKNGSWISRMISLPCGIMNFSRIPNCYIPAYGFDWYMRCSSTNLCRVRIPG